MKIYLLLIFCLFGLFAKAQTNLVPNPSFEEHWYIPGDYPTLLACKNWFKANDIYPNYFSRFGSHYATTIPWNVYGYQDTHTGDFYTGIYARVTWNYNNSEWYTYLEVELIDSLISGQQYYVEFYTSLADSSNYTINNIGAYFSNDSIDIPTSNRLSQYIPQIVNNSTNPLIDTINWTKISGVFTAQGGERFITIGNFNTHVNDDSVYVGETASQNKMAFIYIDDVKVTTYTVGIEENNHSINKIYPTLTTGLLYFENTQQENCVIEFYNANGQLVYNSQVYNFSNTELNLSHLAKGMYYARIVYASGKVDGHKIVLQ